MAISKKKTNKIVEKYEERSDICKLFMYFTIVNKGLSKSIVSVFNTLGCAASFIHHGRGTASKQILDILGVEDNKKEVIISIVREDVLEDIKRELAAFFADHPNNKGIGFSVNMTSIIGVRAYQFLSNSF
jgi:hypothetical protein